MLSSLGNEDVRDKDSCMFASKIDSLVLWAIACARDILNKWERDLKATSGEPTGQD